MSNEKFYELADKAYEKCLDMNPGSEFDTNDPMQAAYLVVNLIGQVNNGGFHQWATNGYALDAEHVLEVLRNIGTATAMNVHEMVAEVAKHIDFSAKYEGCFGNYWIDGDDDCDDDEHEDPFYGIFDDLDDRFYKINDKLESEVVAYFA